MYLCVCVHAFYKIYYYLVLYSRQTFYNIMFINISLTWKIYPLYSSWTNNRIYVCMSIPIVLNLLHLFICIWNLLTPYHPQSPKSQFFYLYLSLYFLMSAYFSFPSVFICLAILFPPRSASPFLYLIVAFFFASVYLCMFI